MKIKYKSTSGHIKSGEVEINNLEDLQNFRKTLAVNEEIILSRHNNLGEDVFEIEIYDTYRE